MTTFAIAELVAWPEAWPLLLAAPIGWLLFRTLDKGRMIRRERWIGRRSAAVADVARGERRTRRMLVTFALLFAGLAVLQPLWGEEARSVEQGGVDVVVCLDVSQSMLARDLTPDRLRRAQAELATLADAAAGDRFGLVVFAGEARLAAPLTGDLPSFVDFVELADPLSIPKGGTDLGAALELAMEALGDRTGGEPAVILLLTDGEDLEERGLRAAATCAARNITVHCVGFGSERGSKITIVNEEDGSESFLLDAAGNEVVSSMDPASLRRIAEATGGVFVSAGARTAPLVDLYEARILPMTGTSFDSEEQREKKNRFQWPLLAAFLLWTIELSLTDRRRRRLR